MITMTVDAEAEATAAAAASATSSGGTYSFIHPYGRLEFSATDNIIKTFSLNKLG